MKVHSLDIYKSDRVVEITTNAGIDWLAATVIDWVDDASSGKVTEVIVQLDVDKLPTDQTKGAISRTITDSAFIRPRNNTDAKTNN